LDVADSTDTNGGSAPGQNGCSRRFRLSAVPYLTRLALIDLRVVATHCSDDR